MKIIIGLIVFICLALGLTAYVDWDRADTAARVMADRGHDTLEDNLGRLYVARKDVEKDIRDNKDLLADLGNSHSGLVGRLQVEERAIADLTHDQNLRREALSRYKALIESGVEEVEVGGNRKSKEELEADASKILRAYRAAEVKLERTQAIADSYQSGVDLVAEDIALLERVLDLDESKLENLNAQIEVSEALKHATSHSSQTESLEARLKESESSFKKLEIEVASANARAQRARDQRTRDREVLAASSEADQMVEDILAQDRSLLEQIESVLKHPGESQP